MEVAEKLKSDPKAFLENQEMTEEQRKNYEMAKKFSEDPEKAFEG